MSDKGIKVTATDLETGRTETQTIQDDFVILVAGNRYVSSVQHHPKAGTTVISIKTRKEPDR